VDYSSLRSPDEIADAIGLKNKTRPCQKWSYDNSIYPRTIITDVNIFLTNLSLIIHNLIALNASRFKYSQTRL